MAKRLKNMDVVPKKRGRRSKKILNELPNSTHRKKSDDNDTSAIILKVPFNMTGHIKATSKNTKIEANESSDESSNDMFADDIPTQKGCNMCKRNKLALDNAMAKITRYEKEEKIANSNKIYNTDLKFISYTSGKKIRLTKSKIRCRWDGHKFDTLPCFLPEYYKDGIYYVTGCFCSFNCALSHNLYYIKDAKIYQRKSLVYKLYREMYGLDDDKNLVIREAPPVEILEEYGGTMSIEKFRKGFHDLNKQYVVVIPPIRPINICVEERIP